MERAKRDDMSFSRKRSFTFGAYGGWVKNILSHIRAYIFHYKSVWLLCRYTALFLGMSNCLCQIRFPLQVVFTSLFTVWTDSHVRMSRGEVLYSVLSQRRTFVLSKNQWECCSCLLMTTYLLLQTWIWRGKHSGRFGISCCWEQDFHHSLQQPQGGIIIISILHLLEWT